MPPSTKLAELYRDLSVRAPRRLAITAKGECPSGYTEQPCAHCGQPFWCSHRHAAWIDYCSPQCQAQTHRLRRKAERQAQAAARQTATDYGQCEVCDQPLRKRARRASRRYCSNACRQWAYRRRR